MAPEARLRPRRCTCTGDVAGGALIPVDLEDEEDEEEDDVAVGTPPTLPPSTAERRLPLLRNLDSLSCLRCAMA